MAESKEETMKLLSINEVWLALKAQNVHIKKVALRALIREGKIGSVLGRTTVESVLAYEAKQQSNNSNP